MSEYAVRFFERLSFYPKFLLVEILTTHSDKLHVISSNMFVFIYGAVFLATL